MTTNSRTPTWPTDLTVTTRTLALLPIILFLPTLISYAVALGSVAAEYTGVLFHVAFLFLVARLDAPLFARAAGFGWLTLDIACGSLMINGVDPHTALALRFGGHVLAGIWFVTVSLIRTGALRTLGVVVGVWLAGFTFVSAVLPKTFLQPAGLLMLIWLALLSWSARNERGQETRQAQALYEA
jgi:hypothetical protein